MKHYLLILILVPLMSWGQSESSRTDKMSKFIIGEWKMKSAVLNMKFDKSSITQLLDDSLIFKSDGTFQMILRGYSNIPRTVISGDWKISDANSVTFTETIAYPLIEERSQDFSRKIKLHKNKLIMFMTMESIDTGNSGIDMGHEKDNAKLTYYRLK